MENKKDTKSGWFMPINFSRVNNSISSSGAAAFTHARKSKIQQHSETNRHSTIHQVWDLRKCSMGKMKSRSLFIDDSRLTDWLSCRCEMKRFGKFMSVRKVWMRKCWMKCREKKHVATMITWRKARAREREKAKVITTVEHRHEDVSR